MVSKLLLPSVISEGIRNKSKIHTAHVKSSISHFALSSCRGVFPRALLCTPGDFVPLTHSWLPEGSDPHSGSGS
jgi:hypothetical protein